MHEAMDAERLDEIVQEIADSLEGDWLLVGGALVALWLDPRRVTQDVDVVGLEGTPAQRMALMDLADRLLLPFEALNSAADWFVRRIPGWESELRPFRSGRAGRVLRPSATLFVLLKIRRLSEQDLEDCRAAVRHAAASDEDIDAARLLRAMADLPTPSDPALVGRRATLAAELGAG
jgi:hypothetical protein